MDEKDMAKYPGLTLRPENRRYYIRVVVPQRLRAVAGKRDIRKSLDTSDRRLAVERYRTRMGEVQEELRGYEQHLAEMTRIDAAAATGRLEDLTTSEIDALVMQWWQEREAHRPTEDDWIPATHQEIADLRELGRQATEVDPQGNDPLEGVVDQVLIHAGFPSQPVRVGRIRSVTPKAAVNRTTSAYRHLRALVERALTVEDDMAVDRAAGTREAQRDRLFNPAGIAHSDAASDLPRSLEDLIQEFRLERVTEYDEESTARKYDLLFRAMREHWGPDMPVRAIDRKRVNELIAFIKNLPPNATKRFKGMTLGAASAAAKATGGKTISANTANSYVQNLFAVLRWAEDQEWITKAPIRGLHLPRRKNVKRRGFKPDELQALFVALVAFKETAPSRFWVPALALYSGARAGELCQLDAADVEIDGDRAFLDFSVFDPDTGIRYEDKRLKTEASARVVPVHRDLIAAGFLEFVKQRKGGRLFPELTLGTKGNYTHTLSKWFGRFKKKVGLTQPSLVLHSFRHGFRDACRTAQIPEETAQALGGWTTMKVSSGYGARDLLAGAMEDIVYGKFRLSAIVKGGANCTADRTLLNETRGD